MAHTHDVAPQIPRKKEGDVGSVSSAHYDDLSIFIILIACLVKRVTQSSSQNCPIEMNDRDWRLLKMCPTLVSAESSMANGMRARFVVPTMLWLLAT